MKSIASRTKTLALLLLTASILLSACGGNPEDSGEPTETPLLDDFTPIVSATGKVVPAQYATLSMEAGGVVVDLAVAEDDAVSAGQTLIVLGGQEQLEAAVSGAQLELLAAQQALDLLQQNAVLSAAQAQADVANARRAVDDAERALVNVQVPAKQTDIDQAYATVILAQDRLDKAQDDFEPYANKPEDNIIRANLLSALAQAQDVYDDAVRRWNNLSGTGTDIDLAQAQANLAIAQATLARAEQELAERSAGPDPDDLAFAQARLENAESQVNAAQAALDRLSLEAPFDGTVSQLFVRENEWVSPGQPIALIGDLSTLQIETTDLNEIDVARIRIGSRVTITIDALPDLVLEGTVIRIATKASQGAGVNYTVIIALDSVPEHLLWDMTAFVDIEVDE
ncbi:MAG: HlyD family efflux transporter periplasmic adaptor subunit [Anaerolineae bacterium]|nr:MAG: HlyD family efflux transporter periplasmic adaptor subunit [Anaerolineae bacterium]